MGGWRWFSPLELLSVVVLLLCGCAGMSFQISTPAPTFSFEELKQRVARVRELRFQRDVTLETRSFEELRELVEQSIVEEQGRDSLQRTARALTRLGLLPESTDWPRALAELRLYEQGLYYDSHALLTLEAGAKSGAPFLTTPWGGGEAGQRQLRQIYALTHVLQEQNFNWPGRLKRRNTEDAVIALGALTRGDAVLTGLAHLVGDGAADRQRLLEQIKEAPRLAAQIENDLSQLPELLRRKAAFQYVQGSQFAMWAYTLHGWDGVNGLYNNPPASTKQVLHPEFYYAKREQPVRLTPWSLLREMGDRKIAEETLGELLIQILLGRELPQGEATETAAGWAGDNLLVFQQGDEMVIAWVTAWEDAKAAAQFFSSYRKALEKRYGISLQPLQESAEILMAPAVSSRPLLLQLKGNFVFFLDGVAASRAVGIAESIWNELEIGAEPQPFDLSKQGPHVPAAK